MKARILTGPALLLAFGVATAGPDSLPQTRLTPDEIGATHSHDSGPGTSGVAGIQTTLLAGDPTKPGLYTIRLSVPANTRIAPHTHRDDRTTTVVSGVWYFGYGQSANEAGLKALPVGSFYSEPAGVAHFAETKGQPVVVYVTGYGPTDTKFVTAADDPGKN